MLEGWGIGEGMMPTSPSGPRCRYKPVAGKYGDRQRSFRAAGGRASPKGFLRAEIRSLFYHEAFDRQRSFRSEISRVPRRTEIRSLSPHFRCSCLQNCRGLAKMVTGNEVSAVRSLAFPAGFWRAEIRSLSPHLPRFGRIWGVLCVRRRCLEVIVMIGVVGRD
jgi:hypothetical protein